MAASFAVSPPEVNSVQMFAGVGPVPMLTAATAWDEVAAELDSAAASFGSVISGLAGSSWQGAASVAMAGAAAPYAQWLSATAAQAAQAAVQARLVAAGFAAALAATVHPATVAGNRARLGSLVASNLLGQNAPAIAAAEAEYEQFWAQDVAAMLGYHAAASEAVSALTPFSYPLQSLGSVAGPPGRVVRAASASVAAAGKDVAGQVAAAKGAIAEPASSGRVSFGISLPSFPVSESRSYTFTIPYRTVLPTVTIPSFTLSAFSWGSPTSQYSGTIGPVTIPPVTILGPTVGINVSEVVTFGITGTVGPTNIVRIDFVPVGNGLMSFPVPKISVLSGPVNLNARITVNTPLTGDVGDIRIPNLQIPAFPLDLQYNNTTSAIQADLDFTSFGPISLGTISTSSIPLSFDVGNGLALDLPLTGTIGPHIITRFNILSLPGFGNLYGPLPDFFNSGIAGGPDIGNLGIGTSGLPAIGSLGFGVGSHGNGFSSPYHTSNWGLATGARIIGSHLSSFLNHGSVFSAGPANVGGLIAGFANLSNLDVGSGNVGVHDIGFGNTGSHDIGLGNTGNNNIGIGNSGNHNIGLGDGGLGGGNNNVGIGLTGDNQHGFGGWNSGPNNRGLFNSGSRHQGIGNSGTGNRGFGNSGSMNTGIANSGIANTGMFNTGSHRNSPINLPSVLNVPAIPVNLHANIPVDIPITGDIGPIVINIPPINSIPLAGTVKLSVGGTQYVNQAVTGYFGSPPGTDSSPIIINPITIDVTPLNLTVGGPTTNLGINITGNIGPYHGLINLARPLNVSGIPVNLHANLPIDIPITGSIGSISIEPITTNQFPLLINDTVFSNPETLSGPVGPITISATSPGPPIPITTSAITFNGALGSPTTTLGVTSTGFLGPVDLKTIRITSVPGFGNLVPSFAVGVPYIPLSLHTSIPVDIPVSGEIGAVTIPPITVSVPLDLVQTYHLFGPHEVTVIDQTYQFDIPQQTHTIPNNTFSFTVGRPGRILHVPTTFNLGPLALKF
ncbi:PPE family protein [Mycobacterium sp.]|uniref:PPE family protein n=1 Tax=Mycobacterium sp. TaxID=1785 RepID=UPI0025F2E31A|nr:PPE family protein [Mycobacterium sp.]MBW0011892.1 PPE family protein [Mycobacterium sp.]